MPFRHPITDRDSPARAPAYHLGRWAARFLTRSPLGRLELAETVAQLAHAVAGASGLPHPALARLLIRGLRLQGWSAGRLARLLGTSPRAVRLWSAGDRLPTHRRVLTRLQAWARGRTHREGVPMTWDRPFTSDSMAGLLELHARALEAADGRQGPATLAELEEGSAILWPGSRDLLDSHARTGYLSSVRQAFSAVAIARGFPREQIARALGREPSTVAYLAGQAVRS